MKLAALKYALALPAVSDPGLAIRQAASAKNNTEITVASHIVFVFVLVLVFVFVC